MKIPTTSESTPETKITVVLHPDEMRALMRVGLKMSRGFGMSKAKLMRMAIADFCKANDEPVVYLDRGKIDANT